LYETRYLALTLASIGVFLWCWLTFLHYFRRWLQEREEIRRVELILYVLMTGKANKHEHSLVHGSHYWLELERIKLMGVYEKHIDSIPMHRKQVIVDTLLQNAALKCKSTDLSILVREMSTVELQTLLAICDPSVKNCTLGDLPDKILLFRLSNPVEYQ
jgi:DNA-binding Xre family transcriptional regulator